MVLLRSKKQLVNVVSAVHLLYCTVLYLVFALQLFEGRLVCLEVLFEPLEVCRHTALFLVTYMFKGSRVSSVPCSSVHVLNAREREEDGREVAPLSVI